MPELLPCTPLSAPGPLRLTVLEERRLDVPSASGVVCLGPDRFAVVDDDHGLYLVAGGAARRLGEELGDLEGLCRGPDDSLLLLAETGEVSRVPLRGGELVAGARPARLGRLPSIGRARNKGWEGIDLLADGSLLAVHEARPRRVARFALSGLEELGSWKLPDDVKAHARDLSDVAVDRRAGRVFLLSDESATIVEARLDAEGLVGVAAHALPVSRKEKPEGLDVDAAGDLWLVTDGKARLYRLRAAPGSP